MDVTTEIETRYVIKMTRLEASRALVAPGELQTAIRGLLQEDDEPESANALEPCVRPALPVKPTLALPATRKAMRKLRQATRRVDCPKCGKSVIKRGLGVHLARAHAHKAEPLAEMVTASNGHG